MLLNKKQIACVVGLLLCGCWQAESAQTYCPPVGCPTGADGGCTPRRITYGYYPTMWRRWPTEGTTPAKQQPENVPTPAKKEPLPKVEADVPVAPVEEAPLFPTDNEPTTPEKSLESSLVPPFDDSAPEPPKDNSGDMGLPGRTPIKPDASDELPPGPSKVEPPAPSDDDLPPIMPEDDPFKDEPEPNKTSAARTLRLEAKQPASPESFNVQAGQRWRATRLSAGTADTSSIKQLPIGEEPRLVSPGEGQAVAVPRVMPTNNLQQKGNPLRLASKPREQQIVPTASWTSEPPRVADPAAEWRRNPLRTN